LAAAVNGRIREKSVLILSAEIGSRRLEKAPEIRNYPGFPEISGEELQQRFLAHARGMGVEIEQARVENIYPGQEFTCLTRDNRIYRSSAVILATGIQQTRFLPGEKEFLGRGVGYCATCDGPLYRDRDVAVIAESPEAGEETNFLAGICRRVYFFPRYRGEINVDPRVEIRREQPREILGRERVTGLALSSGELPVDGVFIIREMAPAERLIEGLRIDAGAVVVDRQMATSISGVFAAGDCTGKPFQVGKAVGEGLTAALSAVHYLDQRKS
jgi:thioredoxin reductase (NADPH)